MMSSRRSLLALLAFGAAAGLPAFRRAVAGDLPKLEVKDPAAAALGYLDDASQVDKKKFPAYVAGSNCENCLLLGGKPGSAYRPCSVFPGKLVAVSGWCEKWAAEM